MKQTRFWVTTLLIAALGVNSSLSDSAYAAGKTASKLEQEAAKIFRKIGIGPEQSEAYVTLYEEFLKSRNMQVRRVINSRSGEELVVMAKKRSRRAANQSVKKMRSVLTDQQLKYYKEYLDLVNEIFLRDAGLR
ncbi:MAG: hypothetical protein AAF541_00495 [Pseudomonadota bacterium]